MEKYVFKNNAKLFYGIYVKEGNPSNGDKSRFNPNKQNNGTFML